MKCNIGTLRLITQPSSIMPKIEHFRCRLFRSNAVHVSLVCTLLLTLEYSIFYIYVWLSSWFNRNACYYCTWWLKWERRKSYNIDFYTHHSKAFIRRPKDQASCTARRRSGGRASLITARSAVLCGLVLQRTWSRSGSSKCSMSGKFFGPAKNQNCALSAVEMAERKITSIIFLPWKFRMWFDPATQVSKLYHMWSPPAVKQRQEMEVRLHSKADVCWIFFKLYIRNPKRLESIVYDCMIVDNMFNWKNVECNDSTMMQYSQIKLLCHGNS